MPILGESDPYIRPFVSFVLRGRQGAEQTIRVRLDTGFDGSLALPPSVVEALGLQAATARRTQLADGSFANRIINRLVTSQNNMTNSNSGRLPST